MFVEQLRCAVEASPRAELPAMSALLWKAYAAGTVSESDAADLSNLIEARKAAPAAQKLIQRRFGSRPRSPASMERRRRWAASGALPPALASRFTLAEQAVLALVAAEHRKRGDCRLTHKEIADVAGVGVSTVKNAIRAARALSTYWRSRNAAWRPLETLLTWCGSWTRHGSRGCVWGWGQIGATLTYQLKEPSGDAV